MHGRIENAAPPATRRNWLSDFEFRGLSLTVRKTGATTRINGQVLHEVAVWLRYYLIVRIVTVWRSLTERGAPRLRFSPSVPRPWYFIRSAAAWGGIVVVGPGNAADAEIRFDDSTWMISVPPTLARHLNFGCTNIAKSRVARIFEASFGYPLSLDPGTHVGFAVEKGEVNSMHDGRIVHCPCAAATGRTYQRLVDTESNGTITDLRTSIIGGEAVAVCVKSRKPADRFRSINNLRVTLEKPEDIFSPDEITRVSAFAQGIGLDWGTLDILRDREDGRIYIVDANKTDVGPVLALSLADQCRITLIMGAALKRFIVSP